MSGVPAGRVPASGVLALVGVLVAGAGITAAASVLPVAAPAPAGQRLPLTLGAPELTCPGPETLAVPEGGRAQRAQGEVRTFVVAADAAGTAGARTRARLRPLDTSARRPRLDVRVEAGAGAAGIVTSPSAGAALIGVANSTTTPPLLAAVQSTLARGGDLRGLVATTCAEAASDTWLVGGGTGRGRRLRLLLANPASTAAVVDIAVHGPDGRVDAPAGQGVVVPPRRQVPLYVDALAPGRSRVAVHVTARTGRVRATLYESVLRGLVPGGVDHVPAAAPAARRQVVPGLALEPLRVREAGRRVLGAGDPAAPGATAVRVAVPGGEEAVVRVRLLGQDGVVDTARPAVSNVGGGAVVDIPIVGVPAGYYAAVVESDVPVVAGAVVGRARPGSERAGTTAGTTGRDVAPAEFAWTAGARPLRGGTLVPAMPGTTGYFAMAAAADEATVRVREVLEGGRLAGVRELPVAAGAAVGMGLRKGSGGVLVEEVSGGPVSAAMVQSIDDAAGGMVSVLGTGSGPASEGPADVAVQDPDLGISGRRGED